MRYLKHSNNNIAPSVLTITIVFSLVTILFLGVARSKLLQLVIVLKQNIRLQQTLLLRSFRFDVYLKTRVFLEDPRPLFIITIEVLFKLPVIMFCTSAPNMLRSTATSSVALFVLSQLEVLTSQSICSPKLIIQVAFILWFPNSNWSLLHLYLI